MKYNTNKKIIISELKKGGTYTAEDFIEKFNMPKSSVYYLLNNLVGKKLVNFCFIPTNEIHVQEAGLSVVTKVVQVSRGEGHTPSSERLKLIYQRGKIKPIKAYYWRNENESLSNESEELRRFDDYLKKFKRNVDIGKYKGLLAKKKKEEICRLKDKLKVTPNIIENAKTN